MKLLSSEIAESACGVLEQILSAADARRVTVSDGLGDQGQLWQELTGGQWHSIGVSEEKGGVGADLRDLVDVAETWGRHMQPLPFLHTVVLLRWESTPERTGNSPLTCVWPSGLMPFANYAGITVVGHGTSGDDVAPSTLRPLDEFAVSLPIATTERASTLPDECLRELRVVCTAEAVGAAAAVLNMAARYATERLAFGHPIGHFQAVKHRLANMHIDVELARTAVIWASQASDSSNVRSLRLALDAARRVASGAIQVHGGLGYTWDAGIHLYLRHILALTKLVTSPSRGRM